jgi:DNA-binding XRE family transcriptional regulator
VKGANESLKLVTRLEGVLAQKAVERGRILGLFRRGRLTDAELDVQFDEISKEEAAVETQLDEVRGRLAGAGTVSASISSAEGLLAKRRKRLDEPVSWELKRHLIEVLVNGVRIETFERDDVRQTNTTVTYRFSEPDRPLALVPPWPNKLRSCRPYSDEPRTIGDHIRKRRLGLKLLQRDAAAQIGVEKASVFTWEANVSKPHVEYMASIIRFLGYNPLPPATTMGEKLIRRRTTLGWAQKDSATRLGVD